TFEGYGAKVKTCILFLEKKEKPDDGAQAEVFMAIAENTGYAPNGAPLAGNELPDILLAWQANRRGDSFDAPNAWTTVVGDRLDPKFYRARSGTPTADVEAVGGDISKRLARTLSDYKDFHQEVADG